MSLTFHVRTCRHDPERDEIQVDGTVDDGILVTGMLARGRDRVASVDEIEMMPDGDAGTFFRLTFMAENDTDPAAWVSAWSGAPTLTLDY